MVKSYLKTFESVYRILHVPTFWHEYQQLWTGDRIDLDVQLKIFLVIAIGSSIFQSRDTALEGKVHQWISAAQNWLSGPLEKDRLTITGLQVYCLTLLARQIFSIGGDLIWISSGSLVNQAMQMGLHRDPRHFAAMSVLQAELRRRLWATVLEIALQSSLDTAMSPRISVGDFDTAPPANINDDDLDESTTNLNLYSAETYTMTSDQLLLFRSMPVRLRALHFLNDFGSEQSYLEALELTKEILDACKSSSAFLARCEVSTFRRNLLDYLQRRFLLPLHCSFANQARAQPLFYYSLKVSLDAAIAIIAPPSDEEYSRLLQVGGGLFREGLRYASITIGLEVLSQAESARENSPSQPDSHRGWAKAMLKRMIDQSLERICSGETNVKNHMFLSMVLAQAGALEAGEPSRLKLAQAAHDSLEYCNRLLQSRVAALPLIECLGMGAATSTSDELGDFGLDLDFDYFMLNGI
ncbi:uncharacterized protein HMPREF1541_00054 [Cyphellophora europaea CBS 101466]|uniref:Xylanolytic transcriptional activator regulatory domain-containing protein n=1 Tax=Cyphellophora europaea (strain CBS 101466) TaxID=1220924 RepID=W2SD00_CYPE1|nr:uncharacterized protein HMPREF1541_00054 [Cyphellophora europaea CBS 101466]ETN45873.1 hypothetical protein HMPREF1541_00054 [Cyphellophora europaea CBS 101466]